MLEDRVNWIGCQRLKFEAKIPCSWQWTAAFAGEGENFQQNEQKVIGTFLKYSNFRGVSCQTQLDD